MYFITACTIIRVSHLLPLAIRKSLEYCVLQEIFQTHGVDFGHINQSGMNTEIPPVRGIDESSWLMVVSAETITELEINVGRVIDKEKYLPNYLMIFWDQKWTDYRLVNIIWKCHTIYNQCLLLKPTIIPDNSPKTVLFCRAIRSARKQQPMPLYWSAFTNQQYTNLFDVPYQKALSRAVILTDTMIRNWPMLTPADLSGIEEKCLASARKQIETIRTRMNFRVS